MIVGINIGPITYKVHEVLDLENDSGSKISGRLCRDEERIDIEKALLPGTKRVTLLHEVIHAILEHAGQSLSEGQIDALAYGLIAFHDSNPGILDSLK